MSDKHDDKGTSELKEPSLDHKAYRHHLVLSDAQISRIIAAGIIGMLFVFIAGYYLGKKNQSEEIAACVKQGAFADRVHSSLCTSYSVEDT